MPLIPEILLKTTVFLFRSPADAFASESAGGTGFLLAVPFDPGERKGFGYLVTAAHVVEQGGATVARVNTIEGGWEALPLNGWIRHPAGDDVAVCPVDSEWAQYDCVPLVDTAMATQEVIDRWAIGPGDDVFLVGRFMQHQGLTRNRPVVRFGHIAMLPAEPIRQTSRSACANFEQSSFLIEVLSVSGFSGSPVFVTIRGGVRRPGPGGNTVTLLGDQGPFLLGLDWGHLDRDTLVKNLGFRDLEFSYPVHSGMTGVVPADKIREVLDLPQLVEERAKKRAQHKN